MLNGQSGPDKNNRKTSAILKLATRGNLSSMQSVLSNALGKSLKPGRNSANSIIKQNSELKIKSNKNQ